MRNKIILNHQPPTTNYPTNFGFTLIEILVVVTVIFLLLGVSFAGYATLNQKQTVISAGQNMKNILRDAQSRSYNGEIDCSVCNCSPNSSTGWDGWYVDFVNKQIYGKCGNNQFSTQNFAFSQDVLVTPFITPPDSTRILFTENSGTVSQPAVICLSNKNAPSDGYYRISINSAGVASDSAGLITPCP